jgi:hypothetical protein
MEAPLDDVCSIIKKTKTFGISRWKMKAISPGQMASEMNNLLG